MQEPPPAPRPMPLSAVGWGAKFLLLFGGIWLAVGLLLTVIFLFIGEPFWVDWRLDADGETVEGEALEVTSSPSHRSNSRGAYVIKVRFYDKQGKKHVTEVSTFDADTIVRAQVNKPIKLDCDPEDPTVCRARGGSASLFGYLALIPAPFGLVGLLLVGIGLRSALRQRSIYRLGTPVLATVSEVGHAGGQVNRRPVMRARYGFAIAGQSYEGDKKDLAPPSVGESIWVLYDPADPRRNVAA